MSEVSITRDPSHTSMAGQDENSFEYFARNNFIADVPAHYSRKEIRKPILKSTPITEKDAVRQVDKIIMRFMGDLPDYRQNMSFSRQPNLGSVMSRIYKDIGVDVPTDQTMSNVGLTNDEISHMKTLPSRPKKGTLRRLTASIAQRLSRASRTSIFHSLPLEESLRDSIDHVHFVAGYGILRPLVRDEIYCMLCRQLRNNPIKASVTRGWQLMQLIAGVFVPSDTVLPHVVRYLEEAPQMYAANVKKQMERTMKNGTRCQPPSHVEIVACLERKPIELNVTLMDGQAHYVHLDAASTANEVCNKVANVAGLREKFGFALFAAMNNKVASLGSGSDHVMDSISQCEQINRDQGGKEADTQWRLFFRKEFFLPWENTVHDPVATNLIYAQITRGVILGEYVFDTEDDLSMLAAQQYYIEHGNSIDEESLQAQLVAYIPAERRGTDEDMTKWRKTVMQLFRKHFSGKGAKPPTPYNVRLDIVQMSITRWPDQFSRRYPVRKLDGPDWSDESLTLAVSSAGVSVLGQCKTALCAISYTEITDILGDDQLDHVVMIVLLNGSALKFESFEASDIRGILDFIIQGLLQRSTYAVATQNSKGDDLAMVEGDLIFLSAPAGSGALKHAYCAGTNIRTGQVGNVASNQIYVLAAMTTPPAKIMTLFRQNRHSTKTTQAIATWDTADDNTETSSEARNNNNIEIVNQRKEVHIDIESSSARNSAESWNNNNIETVTNTEEGQMYNDSSSERDSAEAWNNNDIESVNQNEECHVGYGITRCENASNGNDEPTTVISDDTTSEIVSE